MQQKESIQPNTIAAHITNFSNGFNYFYDKNDKYYVRCVAGPYIANKYQKYFKYLLLVLRI